MSFPVFKKGNIVKLQNRKNFKEMNVEKVFKIKLYMLRKLHKNKKMIKYAKKCLNYSTNETECDIITFI